MSLFAIDYTKDIEVEDVTITLKKLSLGDQVEIAKKARMDEVDSSVLMLCASIKAWTVKDANGNAMAVNRDSILKLRMELIQQITKEIYSFNSISSDLQKNL